MKKIFLGLLVFGLSCGFAQAQLGRRVGNAVRNSAERTVIRQAERRTEKAVNEAIDDALDPKKDSGNTNNKTSSGKSNQPAGNSGSGNQSSGSGSRSTGAAGIPAQTPQAIEAVYAKSDFVPGDELIFEDPMDNEQLGEFPSQWDLVNGTSDVVLVNGKKGFELSRYAHSVKPLMKNPTNYLGDVFTIEFDFLSMKEKSNHEFQPQLRFFTPDGKTEVMSFRKAGNLQNRNLDFEWISNDGKKSGRTEAEMAYDTWHHIAMSFNKRAWKVYVNGVRVINVPNVSTPPGWFDVFVFHLFKSNYTQGKEAGFIFSNFRIAKGAVPLYDRMMTDGKIISYGITFDVGKSTIKPESMGEINRIAMLMKEQPELKFSVEGHTDNTGNAASNQSLSEARSQAVVDKLVENGISRDRLTADGKGQNAPVADNGTEEGRTKNRRVEFVKN